MNPTCSGSVVLTASSLSAPAQSDLSRRSGGKYLSVLRRMKVEGLAAMLIGAIAMSPVTVLSAPASTAFTYQGQLKHAGIPLNGTVDFQFSLWDAAIGGAQIGSVVPLNAVNVADGLFTVMLDFGAAAFSGDARWLQLAVRFPAGSGAFTTLSPRQPLAAAPYALYALDGPGGVGYWAATGADIHNTNSGKVGIGTDTPTGLLGVESTANVHGVWSVVPYIAIYGHRTGTTGTWPAVHAECDSVSASASAIRGYLNSTNAGAGSAAVRGENRGTDGDGAGVYGLHAGSGIGVHGESTSGSGVYGVGHSLGVKGKASDASGWGGMFLGSGDWGSGQALLVMGDSLFGFVQVAGGTDTEPGSGGFLVLGSTGSTNISMDNNEIQARYNGSASTLYLNNGGGSVAIGGATSIKGNVTVRSASTNAVLIELGEGLDYAEGFNVSDKSAIAPGMVLVIDPDHPGKLTLSTQAYDKRVAGIAAGANGLGSAVRLGAGQFDLDVALAGRVYCQVDATEHGVEPGDLLTTSAVPGHAMKVTDPARAMGAVLGKAMEPLRQGEKGQILVLVTLQ